MFPRLVSACGWLTCRARHCFKKQQKHGEKSNNGKHAMQQLAKSELEMMDNMILHGSTELLLQLFQNPSTHYPLDNTKKNRN